MSDYLSIIYDDSLRPYTQYPEQLAGYLFSQFQMKPGHTLLESGCGRGEVLRGFKGLGLEVRGNDLSGESKNLLSDIDIDTCDVENDGLPYPDNNFDILYSKSFLEHFYYPEKYVKEAFRVLKPGGLLLSLVPDWEASYQKYFDDYTHRTPFTFVSLRDIQLIHGFEQVQVLKFRQLPILWRHPSLNIYCNFIAPFVPIRTKNKMRWIREIMLIGVGKKPNPTEENQGAL